jgi:prevent-host-death family protein
MQQQITLREANQHLSEYIQEVEQGVEFIITRHGQPVARLLPIPKKRELTLIQQQAWKRLSAKLNKGYHLGDVKFKREDAHER